MMKRKNQRPTEQGDSEKKTLKGIGYVFQWLLTLDPKIPKEIWGEVRALLGIEKEMRLRSLESVTGENNE